MPRQPTINTPINSEREFYSQALRHPSPMESETTRRDTIQREMGYYGARRFGVEIEAFGLDRNTVARILEDHGIPCVAERYNHDTRDYWKVITDSSIRPSGSGQREGFELVSPPLSQADGIEQVKKVLVIIREAGARVNASCGIHVHVDCRNSMSIELAQVMSLRYSKYEKELELFFTTNRREERNVFCRPFDHEFPSYETVKAEQTNSWAERYPCVRPNPDNERIDELAWIYMLSSLMGNSLSRMTDRHNTNLNSLLGANNNMFTSSESLNNFIRSCFRDRYRKINFMSFIQHGTVEFRQLEGTLDEVKVAHWINFCLTFVSESALLAKSYVHSGAISFDTPSRISYFLNMIKDHPFSGMAPESAVYMLGKIKRVKRSSFDTLNQKVKERNEFNQDYAFRKQLTNRMNVVYPNIRRLANSFYTGKLGTPSRFHSAVVSVYAKMPKEIVISDDGSIAVDQNQDTLDYVENFGNIVSADAIRADTTRIMRTPSEDGSATYHAISSRGNEVVTLDNIRSAVLSGSVTLDDVFVY